MLPPAVVDEIRRLLAEGRLSQRQIARRIGVSRGTVAAIASGRRRIPAGEASGPPGGYARGKPVRCPGCGARVHMPCLACWLRERYGRR